MDYMEQYTVPSVGTFGISLDGIMFKLWLTGCCINESRDCEALREYARQYAVERLKLRIEQIEQDLQTAKDAFNSLRVSNPIERFKGSEA